MSEEHLARAVLQRVVENQKMTAELIRDLRAEIRGLRNRVERVESNTVDWSGEKEGK